MKEFTLAGLVGYLFQAQGVTIEARLEKPKRLGYHLTMLRQRLAATQLTHIDFSPLEFYMPTVLRLDGFEVRIYLNDHEPAHVHVFRAGGEAKIKLGLGGQEPMLLQVTPKMSNRDATSIRERRRQRTRAPERVS